MSGSVDVSKAFASPKLLIRRANKHIGDVILEIKRFTAREQHIGIVEHDVEARQDRYKVRITREPLDDLNAIIKDAAGNLRDVLDHAVYASAIALNGGSPSKTGFPIGKDAKSVDDEMASPRLKDVPSEIRPLLASFRPYERRDGLIFGLNQIRNPNTHRAIVAAQHRLAPSINISNGVFYGAGYDVGYMRWNAANNEVEFLSVPHGSKFDLNVTITIYVTFQNVKVLDGMEVVSTLNEIAREVEGIVLAIEAETVRLLEARGV